MTYVLALLMAFSNIQSEPDCSSLRLGKFRTIGYSHDSIPNITVIERTENFQIERNIELGIEYKFKIDWFSDCSYKLTWIETTRNTNNFDIPIDQILTFKIINIEPGYYTLIGSSNLKEQQLEGIVEILELNQ